MNHWAFLTLDFLNEEHFIKNKSLKQIARENYISEGSIYYIVEKLGFKSRNVKDSNILIANKKKALDEQKYSFLTKELLEDLYFNEKLTMEQIGKKLNVFESRIFNCFVKYGIKARHEIWNKGLKAKDDERVKKACDACHEAIKEKYASGELVPWNKGLNKFNSPSVAKGVEKLSEIRKVIFAGSKCPLYGFPITDEIRRKQSLAKGGNGIPYYYEVYGKSFNTQLKRLIRSRDNYVCQVCGKTEIENGEALSIHHIDYDKKNCDESNLISVCRPCHSKTLTRREYWKEFFANKFLTAMV
jgi:hypothetical protein